MTEMDDSDDRMAVLERRVAVLEAAMRPDRPYRTGSSCPPLMPVGDDMKARWSRIDPAAPGGFTGDGTGL